MPTFSRIDLIVLFLRLNLLAAIAVAVLLSSWFNLFIAVTTLILTFLPTWFEKQYKIDIPLDFEFAAILLIYASLFLGEIVRFYDRFWWWDILLHTASAIAFACIGFVVLAFLLQANKVASKPFWIVVFSFCFSLSIGALWEIFEFFVDTLFGFNMQKTGLTDTMWDLVSDGGGALIASVAGYGYLMGNRESYLGRLFDLFVNNLNSSNGGGQ